MASNEIDGDRFKSKGLGQSAPERQVDSDQFFLIFIFVVFVIVLAWLFAKSPSHLSISLSFVICY